MKTHTIQNLYDYVTSLGNEIYSEEFKQPLFGKNYIKGKCRPYFQNQFGNFTFTIWVKGSRVGTLVGVFFTLIDSLRNNQGRNHNFEMMKNLKDLRLKMNI